jgi:hypothetical protein
MPSDPPPPEPGSDRGAETERETEAERETETQRAAETAREAEAERETERESETERPQTRARAGSERPKRPRFLLVALISALVLGAGCWTEGCDRMRLYKTPAFYSGEPDPGQIVNATIKSDEDRGRAEALYQHFIEVAEQARKRAFPMAAATWVLGAALLALAARGLGGRTNTRHALVQVVLAQAAVVVATYFVTPDLRNAELDWEQERTLIHQRETLPPEQYQQVIPMMASARRYGVPGWLVFRSFVSLLIVVALTRPRARQFFEAAGKTVSEG